VDELPGAAVYRQSPKAHGIPRSYIRSYNASAKLVTLGSGNDLTI
jgi:hypothetical protein